MQICNTYKSAASGGITSYITGGGDPLQGAAQGLVVYFANHLAHVGSDNDVVLPGEGEGTKPGQYYPAPKDLEGFPDAKRIDKSYGKRTSWLTKDGKLLQWDSYHGEVEVYTDMNGQKGSYRGPHDPSTGKAIQKGFDTNRTAQLSKQISKGYFKELMRVASNSTKIFDKFFLALDFINWDIINYYLNNPPTTVNTTKEL